MIYRRISLQEQNRMIFLDVYAADELPGQKKRNAILIMPGGGYKTICADREGEPVALAFLPHGYVAFVLHYSVTDTGNNIFPEQLYEASLAMKYIKDHAEDYVIDKERVFAVGFSAGGHLTGCLGTMWDREEIYQSIKMPYGYNKPTGIMLIYPVITGIENYAESGSICNLWGSETPSLEQRIEVSIEKHVTKIASPAYLVHTANDEVVNVKNTLAFAAAYREAGVPFELHIFPDGPHGMALGNSTTNCGNEKYYEKCYAKWVENAILWAEKQK